MLGEGRRSQAPCAGWDDVPVRAMPSLRARVSLLASCQQARPNSHRCPTSEGARRPTRRSCQTTPASQRCRRLEGAGSVRAAARKAMSLAACSSSAASRCALRSREVGTEPRENALGVAVNGAWPVPDMASESALMCRRAIGPPLRRMIGDRPLEVILTDRRRRRNLREALTRPESSLHQAAQTCPGGVCMEHGLNARVLLFVNSAFAGPRPLVFAEAWGPPSLSRQHLLLAQARLSLLSSHPATTRIRTWPGLRDRRDWVPASTTSGSELRGRNRAAIRDLPCTVPGRSTFGKRGRAHNERVFGGTARPSGPKIGILPSRTRCRPIPARLASFCAGMRRWGG